MEPLRSIEPDKQVGKPILNPEQPIGKQLRGIVSSLYGEPQHSRQQKQHSGNTGGPGGKQSIQPFPPCSSHTLGQGLLGGLVGCMDQAGRQLIAQVRYPAVGQLLSGPGQRGLKFLVLLRVPACLPCQAGRKRGISLQQPQRRPAYREFTLEPGLQKGFEGGSSKFHLGRITNWPGLGRLLSIQQMVQCFHQLLQPLLPPSGTSNHWNAQIGRQSLQIHRNMLAGSLVQQVDTHHASGFQLQGLEHQIQIALQTGGVAHHHRTLSTTEAEKIPCHFLLSGVG